MVQVLWIGAVTIIGGLVGLRREWRYQAADAVGCVAALGLACWQYRRIVPYVRVIWPDLGSAAPPVALIYLFAALYGFAHILLSLYPPRRVASTDRRWVSGVIGAVEAGAIAVLSMSVLCS